jgi:hypothetical protein
MLSDPKWDEKIEVKFDEASLHLLRAADYIQQHGWCQGKSFGPNETVCILGALDHTKGSRRHFRDAVDKLRSFIGGGAVNKWNDACGRTKDEVLHIMRKAAYLGK